MAVSFVAIGRVLFPIQHSAVRIERAAQRVAMNSIDEARAITAGLGIADLREFTVLLREGGSGDRITFLSGHRAELSGRVERLQTAIAVLDEKIAHYTRDAAHG